MTDVQIIGRLEVVPLGNGRIVRPAYTIGTCGWHPRPWQAANLARHQSPAEAFLAANPNWQSIDLQGDAR